VLLSGESGNIQKLVYSLGKLFQFLLPVFFVFFLERQFAKNIDKLQPNKNQNQITYNQLSSKLKFYYLCEGFLFGAVVFCVMFFLYYFCFSVLGGELAVGSVTHKKIVGKIIELGLIDYRLFFLFGCFYAVIHSGLEEYYWRWFVFGKLREISGIRVAIIISGLGFAAHHVILLHTFFGFSSILCPLGSIAVAIGGIYWAWLYQRSNNLLGAWLGHGIIDAAIFLTGYIIYSA
jgi:membrane protease YdiL (CAAX protease family)